MPGDILDPNLGNRSEFEAAKAACKTAWDALAGRASLLGPIALNVRKLVKSDGSENLQGYGEFSYTGAANLCANPPTGIQTATGALAIADYSFVRSFDPDEEILAHEFGHVLSLEHGNGKDDDNDGPFDGDPNYSPQCDPSEVNAASPSLMTPGMNAKLITALQKGRSRVLALKYSGTASDPPAALIPGDTIGDEHVDSIHDVSDRSIDITSLIVATHTPTQSTVFSHELIDLLPPEPSHQFLVFADLDDEGTTGGAPDDLDLGVPTAFQGAELVTRVIVEYQDGVDVIPTLWKFQGGSFVEMSDASIQASVDTAVGGEVPQSQYDVVSIRFSNAVRGAMNPTIRIQAFAQSPLPPPPPPPDLTIANASDPAPFDVAPDGIGVDPFLRIVPPNFPVAGVTPLVARPGQAVTVEAIGLFANAMTKVFLGDDMVGVGNSDGAGGFVRSFVVPFNAALGERLVTVGTFGTGLTADTSLIVAGDPLPPTPVAIDVKPGSCPNPFNVREKGKVPVAILGSATLDVSQLDPSLVLLEGVPPLSSAIADVATPFLPIRGRTGARDCTTAGPDGFPDLVLHFDARSLAEALGAVANKQVRVLELTGNLKPELGGAPILGEDVVISLTK